MDEATRLALAAERIDATAVQRLRIENAALREWIRGEGVRTNICTFDILGGEVCENCRCERSRKD